MPKWSSVGHENVCNDSHGFSVCVQRIDVYRLHLLLQIQLLFSYLKLDNKDTDYVLLFQFKVSY